MKQDQKNQEQPGQDQAGNVDVAREPARKCSICGGPNHYGCGCEAKQLREAEEAGLTGSEAKALQEPEQQPAEPGGPQPAEPGGPQPAEPGGPQLAEPGPGPQPDQELTEAEKAVLELASSLCDVVELLKTISALLRKMEARLYDAKNIKPRPAKRTVRLKSKKRR